MSTQTNDIKLPCTWHYNLQSLRMERTVEVRDENDELVGYNEHCAVVPRDIIDFVNEMVEKELEGFIEYVENIGDKYWDKFKLSTYQLDNVRNSVKQYLFERKSK